MSDDFRIRKVPSGYKIWQRVGSGWEALADVYGTRAQAREAVLRFEHIGQPRAVDVRISERNVYRRKGAHERTASV